MTPPFYLVAASVGALAVVSTAKTADAATIQVGPGQTYTTPCAAIAAASAGDEIDITAGTYTDTCTISTAGLHLKGVGGQPKIDVTGVEPAGDKGIYAIEADDVIIENLELMGASISDALGANGAGLRIQSNGVVVTHCYIHDNQDGILSGPLTAGTGTLTIDHTELKHNGLGDGCNVGGCTHNVYTGHYARFIFQFNWSHSNGSDGHLFKSRAVESDILYNRITGETGQESYDVDLPNGGVAILVGNVIEKSASAQNPTLLDYGEEGYGTGTNTLYLADNTFVNDDTTAGSPIFVNVANGGTLAAAHNNIFAGPGSVSSTGALSTDNLAGTEASFLFADASAYNYHLLATSPAIGKGVAAGSAGAFSLTPAFEYIDPLSSVPRLTAGDVGAFEYGTNTSDPSSDAGAESEDGAAIASQSDGATDAGEPGPGSDSGSGSDSSSSSGLDSGSASGSDGSVGGDAASRPDAGGRGQPAASSSGGCATSGRGDRSAAGLFGIGVLFVALTGRARRRRT